MPFRRCSAGVRATRSSTSDTRSPTKYGMPHAEYDVYGPRSNATISRSSGSRRRRARAAAVMPAASPPMTTSRSVTRGGGSCRRLRPQAAERLDHGLGLGAERERRRQAEAAEQATGGHNRNAGTARADHRRHERQRGVGARVAAGLGALGAGDVAAGFAGGDRVADLPAHVDDEDVVV